MSDHVLVDFEDLAGGPIPTEAGGLFAAAADEAGAQFLIEQHIADAARDIEDVLGVDLYGGVADHFGERADVGGTTGVPHAMASSGGSPKPS